MIHAPIARFESEGGRTRIVLEGAWTISAGAAMEAAGRSVEALPDRGEAEFDLSRLDALDTAGAWVISRSRETLAASGRGGRFVGAKPEHEILLREAAYGDVEPAPAPIRNALTLVGDMGESVYLAGRDLIGGLDFIGRIVVIALRGALRPQRWRLTSVAFHLEHMGLRGAPLILMINFFVGAIVAQQGVIQLARFGASRLTVNLVAILTLRELGVMLTSIMVAGRSGSAMTAELGAMNMREELDALRVMALDPLEALVLPRLIALVIALPLLTFLGDIAALIGGMLVTWTYGGVNPQAFWGELQYPISVTRFLSGLGKAPFMALVIGIIATMEGFAVKGSAESLGRRVTASVAKSIFTIILLDGLFAMFYAAVNV